MGPSKDSLPRPTLRGAQFNHYTLKPRKLAKILPSSVTANPVALSPAIGGRATFQHANFPLEASTSMYWAADAKKTETRPLLQRSKLFPAELTFKVPSRDLQMESRATSGPSDTLWITAIRPMRIKISCATIVSRRVCSKVSCPRFHFQITGRNFER